MIDTNEPPFDRREYLLPPGCKDLIDKTRLAREQSQRKPGKHGKREKPVVYLPSRIIVRDLASALGAKLPKVITLLKEMKVFTSINQKIPFYTAAKVAARCGYEGKKKDF